MKEVKRPRVVKTFKTKLKNTVDLEVGIWAINSG
jgi:hypothetical protein